MAKNIFTVRHGEALHQVNSNIWKTCSNGEIPLTSLGISQSMECGRFLANMHLNPETTLIVTSPYKRAVQTAEQIANEIKASNIIADPLVAEQDFGMFTGLTTEQCYAKYPHWAKLYDIHAERRGDYLVKPPKGENKESVVKRAEQFLKTIWPRFRDSKYENLIIVSHCVFNRATNKVLNQATPKWFLALAQQPNGAIRQFSFVNNKWRDKGFVFIPKNQGRNRALANPYNFLNTKGIEK